MKTQKLFFSLLVLCIIAYACKKPAEAIQGIYSGQILVNAASAGNGTVSLSRVSDNLVDLKLNINTNPAITYNNVTIAGVENPYVLSYTSTPQNLYGGVNGNKLNFTIYDTSGTQTSFSGDKQ